MLKNLIVAAILMVAVPVLANAWTFPVSVTNTTAGINAGNKATVTIQGTSTDVTVGTRYFYPANTVPTVSVAIANIGNVTSISLDGATQPLTTPVVVTKGAASLHSLTIIYASNVVQKRNVTVAQAGGGLTSLRLGGSVQSTTGFTDVPVGTSLDVVAQPNSGYSVTSIKINGVEKVTGPSSGLGSTSAVTKTFQVDGAFTPNVVSAGYEAIPYINATLSVPAAVAAAEVQAVVSATSNVSPLNYNFATTCSTQTQNGPSSTFLFTPVAEGTCSVSVTVTGPGGSAETVKTATLTVTSGTAADNYACISCHAGSTPVVVSLYNGSPHTKVTSCQACHTSSAHSVLPSGDVCRNCHADSAGAVPDHPLEIGGNPCTTCHDAHSTSAAGNAAGIPAHYNNSTSATHYPASYVTSRSACGNCHSTGAVNPVIRHEWAQSRHAATTNAPWMAQDFKVQAACVQCHTTTGFIAYSTGRVTSAWGDAADRTKEVLSCIGCHKSITTGSLRTVTPVGPYAGDSYVNPDTGKSNICMDCHSGRNAGAAVTSLLAAHADFTSLSFTDPHYLSAGGIMYGKTGYHFPGRTYSSKTAHINLGAVDGKGPCVTCHKNSTYGHTFKTGAIAVCAGCHGASLSAEQLDLQETAFVNALEVLRAQLAAGGFFYAPGEVHFTNRNWGTDLAGANTMGAAFNYAMLLAEPGAYAHNSAYTRQLISDSIDAAYHGGTVTGSIDDALSSLVGNGITREQADQVLAYRVGSGCLLCHQSLSGAHDAHVGSLPGSASYGDDGNYSTAAEYRFGCGNCHPLDPSLHCNGVVDVELSSPAATGFKMNNPITAARTGAGTETVCFNTYCHSSGQEASVRTYVSTPQWGSLFAGNRCAACHGDPPAYGSSGAGSAGANSHYTQTWSGGQMVEGGHLVGLHFDNVKADPPFPWGGLMPKAGGGGSGAGHGDPATSTTISCPTCHAGTVNAPSFQSAPYTAFSCASCHGAKPAPAIADKSLHVNGSRDVAFTTGTFRVRAQIRLANFTSVIEPQGWTRNNGYKAATSFDSIPFSGSYSTSDKGCTTVCHFNQRVRWGDSEGNCISCHTDL